MTFESVLTVQLLKEYFIMQHQRLSIACAKTSYHRDPSCRRGAIVLLIAFCVSACHSQSTSQHPNILTSQGEIIGIANETSLQFRGIPYAEPPLGALRWQPPQDHEHWSEPLVAQSFGAPCPQPDFTEPTQLLNRASEDCLTLNISVPKRQFIPPPSADPTINAPPLPVLVHLHGGAFMSGSASTAILDGAVLNRNGIILVTLNYRLGALGFFAHPALDAPNGVNYGLMDMVAALRWVQQHIGAFGGDKNRVTIKGLSAGGMAVQMLMVSPQAQGLFAGAISQSGYGTWPLPRLSRLPNRQHSLDAEQMAHQITARAVPGELQTLTAKALHQISPAQWVQAVGDSHLPIVDGHTLPEEPAYLFAQSQQHAVPYLTGGNTYDGSVYPYLGIGVDELLALAGDRVQEIKSTYGITEHNTDDPGVRQLFGDMRYVLASRYSAEQMHNVNQPGFLYLYDYEPAAVPAQPEQGAQGTPHGWQGLTLFKDSAIPVVKAEQSYLINFILSGNPNGAGLRHWPAITKDKTSWLVLDEEPRIEQGVRQQKLDLLQAIYLDRLND